MIARILHIAFFGWIIRVLHNSVEDHSWYSTIVTVRARRALEI